jgi:DNA repair exonuclease SbcCD ATPase subunit
MDSLYVGRFIAANEWEVIAPMAIALGMFVVLPIIYLLLNHQRKMAEFFHGARRRESHQEEELRQLRSELAELRSRLNEHILAVENRREQLQSRVQETPEAGG